MLRTLRASVHALMIAVLMAAGGAHLAVLQVTAWGTMIASDVQDHGMEAAIDRTFSGEFPCELCKRIAKSNTSSDERPADPFPVLNSHLFELKLIACDLLSLFPPIAKRSPWTDTTLKFGVFHSECPHGPPKGLV
ncbi:MAG: hypothetical protein AAGJ79_10730 [Verrucomicrobiota bacterium]